MPGNIFMSGMSEVETDETKHVWIAEVFFFCSRNRTFSLKQIILQIFGIFQQSLTLGLFVFNVSGWKLEFSIGT